MCCPGEEPRASKLLKEIRRKPQIPVDAVVDPAEVDEALAHGVSTKDEDMDYDEEKETTTTTPEPMIPPSICSDGSDALLDQATGQPRTCGSGFDGHQMCPKGFYCRLAFNFA